MEDKLNAEALGKVIEAALDADQIVSVNIHGVDEIETAIDFSERILGHRPVEISHQTSCFVVKARAGKSDVNFFVRKTPFS